MKFIENINALSSADTTTFSCYVFQFFDWVTCALRPENVLCILPLSEERRLHFLTTYLNNFEVYVTTYEP